MDQDPEVIENFEDILKNNINRSRVLLYKNSKSISTSNYKPKDVIVDVSSQLKAIKKADKVMRNKNTLVNVCKHNSNFLPVHKLSVFEGQPSTSNKFETQCELDTQLLDLIRNAEECDGPRGMTQEFETTFTHAHDLNKECSTPGIKMTQQIKHYSDTNTAENLNTICVSTEAKDTSNLSDVVDNALVSFSNDRNKVEIEAQAVVDTDSEMGQDKGNQRECFTNSQNEQDRHVEKFHDIDKEIEVNIGTCSLDILSQFEDNTSPIDKKYMNKDTDCSQRCVSPILKLKTIKQHKRPLVYDLETFEKFESIAMPLVAQHTDMKTAKHLINSQILGTELTICDNAGLNADEQLSQIIELKAKQTITSKGSINKVDFPIAENKADDRLNAVTALSKHTAQSVENLFHVKQPKMDSISIVNRTDITKAQSIDNYDDEILFSSDEEDYKPAEYEDMPFTCALETSFYDMSQVLDKTMFVAFQTASNKSIQVQTDSFHKAKTILDDFDQKGLSITELVKISDMAKESQETINNLDHLFRVDEANDEHPDRDCIIEETGDGIRIQRHNKFNANMEKRSELPRFQGFTTASNKTIKLSEQALSRCREVFQDIDIAVDHDSIKLGEVVKTINIKNTNTLVASNMQSDVDSKPSEDALKHTNVENEYFINESINDDLLIKEFENIEMSLGESFVNTNTKVDKSGINVSKSVGIEAGNDENNRLEHIPQFQGFKTANNKHINISKDALAETKKIFQDIDCLDIVSGNNVKEKQSCPVPETELNKPSTSKSNIFDSFKTVDVNNVLDKSADQLFVGFKTAANKSIAISKEAVDKSRRIFDDIQNCPEKEFYPLPTRTETTKENLNHGLSFIKTDIKRHTDIKKSTQSVDFQRFPEHVSAETKILVKNNDINENVTCGAENKNHNPISTTYRGFTANDKPVIVSKDAFAKSKQLFQYFNDSLETDADSFDKDPLKFQGNTARIKTDNTLELVVNGVVEKKQDFNSDVEAKENVLQPNVSAKAFEGFTTASNKPVPITKEALLKSKKLFEDIDMGVPNDNELLSPSNKAQSATVTFRGFSTASNKPVQVSEEALLKSKKLFDDVSQCNESSVFVGNKARITSTDRFVGFATASNKVVKVSKEALAKSKQMFDDIHSVNQDFTNVGDKPKTIKAPYNIEAKVNALDNTITAMGKLEGFQTGNNRKVPDLVNYQKLKDIDDVKDNELRYSTVKADMAILDTQVLKDFDATLYTEDFQKTPRRNKRSGSPILSCPRAKKRRFETPHRITKIAVEFKNVDALKIPIANADYLDVNYKKNKKYTLKDLLKLERDNSVKKTLPENLSVDFDDLLSITISGERNDLSDTALTMHDIKEVFLTLVNRNLVPENWLDNHLKLILWKLLSYEIKFPSSLRLVCSAKNVLRQLKYRYDTELYGAKRSVLRLILEKDDIPSRTMVLCVVAVLIDGVKVDRPNKPENVELLVTDGWYCLKCTVDLMLAQLACAGRLKVGDKVITSAAELVGCKGLAPWEDTSEVRLKIFGNSTRKARWDLRLGPRGIPALRVSLAGARPRAGPLALRLGLLRVYPALYLRRTDAGTVTRSERLEHLYQIEYEAERQALMEKIYEEVEKRFNEQESQVSDCSALSCASGRGLSSGSQLARALRRSRDPAEFMQSLSASQAGLLQHYTCQRRDRLLREVGGALGGEAGGRVARVLKVRVVDGRGGGRARGVMSVWSPTEAVREMLAEGGWLDVRNVIPTGYRNSEIQISAGRQSVFMPANITRTDERNMFLNSLSRVCYSIKDLMRNPCTENDEVDTFGMVFLIDPAMDKFDSKHHLFQNVYMTDMEKNLLCVNFWGGLKKFGYQNILETGQIVACANLQKRIGNTRKSIPQYRATELSQFTTSPKNDATRNLMRDLEAKFKNVDKNKFFDDCTVLKNNLCTNRYVNNENISPYRFNNSVDLKNKCFIEVPAGNRKDEFNLTGLDFESTFQQSDEQLSPKTFYRKSKVKERIAKLKMYGDPPPLSPMHIMSKSKRAHNSYKSPLISKSDVLSSVASAKKGNDSCNEDDRQTMKSSPIISMNKTHVTRCHINPTKLNFSHNSKDNESLEEI